MLLYVMRAVETEIVSYKHFYKYNKEREEYFMFENLPDILNLKQCQQALQIGRSSMLELIYNGDIQAYKLKGAWKIPKQELQRFVRRLM